MKTVLKHSTFNIQRRTSNGRTLPDENSLNVECSMLDVECFPIFRH